ncbi:MAG: hemerythrin domain-containing protein [Prolixibacteraceae bacterium]
MENTQAQIAAQNSPQSRTSNPEVENLDSANLSDYIVDSHHRYAYAAIPEIQTLIDSVVGTHGAKHPELNLIKDYFWQLSNELKLHMRKEELVLFPYFKKLADSFTNQKQLVHPLLGSVKSPVNVMEMEHETAGLMQKKLFNLSMGFQAPEDASDAYLELFAKLKEFDADLHQHVHLENDVLFPKAIALEQAVLAN